MKTLSLALAFLALSGAAPVQSSASEGAPCLHRSQLEGLWGFRLTIGGREFLDLVNFDRVCQVGWVSGTVEGNLTVPERFTTAILDGSFGDRVGPTDELASTSFSLSIDTLERGEPLKARYDFTDSRDPKTGKRSCSGQITFEGEPDPVPFTCFRFAVDQDYLSSSL